ncbi:MAG: Crp/Fnr family transcriptional regulator [Lagierella massiliensis]|nr:Crp/Fnr family transcriptional regulator [Lagierella massiliensis]
MVQEKSCCHENLCIESIDIFKDLPMDTKLEIMSHSKHIPLKDKTIFFTPNDKVDSIIIVKEGKLKLSNYDKDGVEYIYRILEEDDTFGEELIFTDENYNMYIESIGKTMVCSVTKEHLIPYIMENPDFAKTLIENLGKKLKESMVIKKLLFIKNPKERLEGYLVNKCEETNTNIITLSRETIGRDINLSRETISRKLNEIQAEGNIELEAYKKIIVKNKEKMKKL